MKYKFNKRNIIIFVTLFFLLGVAVFTDSKKDEHLVTKRDSKVSIGVGEGYYGWENGQWEISTLISNVGSNISLSDDGSSATFVAADNSLENNTVELTLDMNYIAESYMWDDFYYMADLYYELPTSLFATDEIASYGYNETDNKVLLYDGSEQEIGYISLGQIYYCSEMSMECFMSGSEFIASVSNDVLQIYNGVDIDSYADYSASISIEYSILPSAVAGRKNTVIPTMCFFYGDIVELNSFSFVSSSDIVEEIDLSNISSKDHIVYSQWKYSWGDEVSGYDYYIEYRVDGIVQYDSEYTISYSTDTNGTVVAYSSYGNDYTNLNSSDFSLDDACKITTTGESDINCHIVVGYDMGDSSTFDSYLELVVEGVASSSNASVAFNWEQILEKEIVEDTPVSYPTGTNKEYTHTLISDDVGVGAVNRIRSGKDTEFTWKLEPTANSINNTANGAVKAFNLWNLTNNGTTNYTLDLEMTGAYIDSSYNSVVAPFSLASSEYVYKSFYLIDDIEYDYVLNSSGNEYILSASELSNYTSKNVYVKISDGSYELIGTIGKNSTGNIAYTAKDSKTTTNNNVSATNPVVLPDNVTDLKITYVGAKAAVYIGVGVDAVLSSSDNLVAEVNGLIVNDKDIVLKNETNVGVNSEKETTLVGTYLTSAYESSTYYGSDSVVNDVYVDGDGYKYDSITYTDYVYEQVDYFGGGESTEAVEFFTEQKNVTIYELLPIGAVLDGEVSVTTYGNNTECTPVVTSTDNYEGTGRTLLKIELTGVNSNIYQGSTFLQSGYNVKFNILYSYLDNQSYGNELAKDMAYYSNGVLTSGYINASQANSSSFSSTAAQNALAKLNSSNTIKNSVYTTESVTVDKINVTVGKYVKEVKSEVDTAYSSISTIMESQSYKYRLKYVFSSDYEEITNLVFVDSLENNYGANSYFRGYLDSIDTSYLDNLGVTTTIYYSTNESVDLTNVDLTDLNSWSTTKPSDVTKIVAIAVSCGDYTFKGMDKVTPMVDINMIASNVYSDQNNKAAYNSSFITYNYFGESTVKTMNSSTTTINLEEAAINLEATTSVGTGTESLPAIVEDDYSYEITISNNSDKYDLEDVMFKITLPEGVSMNTNEISEVSDNSSGTFGTFYYDTDARILAYTLSILLKNETKVVTIPVDVNYETLGNVTSFNANVQLKTVGGKEYDSDAIKLYNKLAVPELEFGKYVDTLDTDGYTDETMAIIEKGETYSYRVSINNVSTIDAKNVKVVDTIPEGLTVVESSINNNGTYDSTNNTITWKVSQIKGSNSINLDYKVVVSDDITLGTKYRSSAHIEVVNPIDDSLMLYDEDTNIVSTLYQIVSNIKVTNNLDGALADTNKDFTYSFEFSGDISYVGSYDVINEDGEKETSLVIDSNGKGTYTTTLKANDSIEFRTLPNGISYTIKQSNEEGYVTTSDDGVVDGDYVTITGVTDEIKQINYSYLNSYSVSTTVDLSAEITYDKEILIDMFALSLVDPDNNEEIQYGDEFGIVNFDTITFDNVEGTFNYVVSQVNTNVNKVAYDTNTFTISVILTDDGKGTLNKTIKYYNKLGEEVDEIVFVNEYVPNGLIIKNVNTSDYIDVNKVFNYKLEITDSATSVGYYEVVNTDGEELLDLVIDENGESSYEFELYSDEKITILDLPEGTKYTVTQELVEYYTTVVSDLTYTVDTENDIVIHSGNTLDSTIQINFNNNYVTSGEFTPSSIVTLLEKELEKDEFNFMLKDVSSGLTNGYVEYVTNSLEGNLEFTTIEYTRPGTYVYEITQVQGDSNHIYYDLSKCILTIVLVDNGDSTMTVESAKYEYSNGKEGFENVYSVEPIVPPVVEQPEDTSNPNTSNRTTRYIVIVGMIILVSILFMVERYTRRKRLSV